MVAQRYRIWFVVSTILSVVGSCFYIVMLGHI